MPPKVSGIKSRVIPQSDERGTLDRYGVDVVTLVEVIPKDQFPRLLRKKGSAHPRFTSMGVSRADWQKEKTGFYRVTYIYEGFLVSLPEPTYILSSSMSEEPIELHPKFSEFAGTPSRPVNGAVFIDPETGKVTKDDSKGVFREFRVTAGGSANLKAGVEAYLSPGAMWTEISFASSRPGDLGQLGEIDQPAGSQPSFGTGRTWIYYGADYTGRGKIFEIRKTWLLSARGGWDKDIY